MVLKLLLFCSILSSLLYVAMNVFVPMLFEGYSLASQTVSELSAIGAPTRPLWVWLGTVYALLVVAFGWGVWKSAGRSRTDPSRRPRAAIPEGNRGRTDSDHRSQGALLRHKRERSEPHAG